jgi:short subunit fatty acids transporter
MGIYSAVLGLFIPWGGGKWIIEASEILMTPCCAASSFLAAGPLWVNFCRRA